MHPIKSIQKYSALEPFILWVSSIFLSQIIIKYQEITKLNQINLANDLKEKIIIRIKERRTVLSDVLQLLHDPCSYDDDCENYGVFNISSKTV